MSQVYAIIDCEALAPWTLDLGEVARALLAGGASTLQLRAKGFGHEQLLAIARDVVGACAGMIGSDEVFINDDVRVAKELAVGVHLGQDDLPPLAARARLGPRLRIGLSTHDEQQLLEGLALPVDYVALGPVRPTANKLRPAPALGVEHANEIARRAKHLPHAKPLVAIGGVAADVVPALTSFDRLAVIGCLLPKPGETGAAALATISLRTRALTDACMRAFASGSVHA